MISKPKNKNVIYCTFQSLDLVAISGNIAYWLFRDPLRLILDTLYQALIPTFLLGQFSTNHTLYPYSTLITSLSYSILFSHQVKFCSVLISNNLGSTAFDPSEVTHTVAIHISYVTVLNIVLNISVYRNQI